MLAGTAPDDSAAWLAAIARNECLSRLRRRPATVALRDDDLLSVDDVEELVTARSARPSSSATSAASHTARSRSRSASAGPRASRCRFGSRKRLQDRLRPFHAASGVAAVPAAIREALSRAIPGFSGGHDGTSGGPGSDDGAAQGSIGSPDDGGAGLGQTTTITTTTTETTEQTTTTSGESGRHGDGDHARTRTAKATAARRRAVRAAAPVQAPAERPP